MVENFNGIFYLIVFIVHFLGFGIYAYQMIIDNKKFAELNSFFRTLISGKIWRASPTPPPELYKSTRLIILKIVQTIELLN